MGTHVTEQSWLGRIGNAFKGILIGGLMALVSVPLLFWNEGRAVRTAKGLKEGASVVVDVPSDAVDSGHEGTFVHTAGQVATDEILRDEDFAIEFNGIRLNRHVEMYQWKEDKETDREKKLGGGTRTVTTYTYEKGWFPGVIDSREFDEPQSHVNPLDMPFRSVTRQSSNVRLGAFRLPDSLIAMIDGETYLDADSSAVPVSLRERAVIHQDGPSQSARLYLAAADNQSSVPSETAATIDTEPTLASPEGDPVESDESVQASIIRRDPATDPQIGDLRIWFTATPVTAVSLLSRQRGDTFEPFQTHYGTEIHVLRVGTHSAAEMIAQEEAANRVLTWLLRAAGGLLMFIGLNLVLRPLVVLADVLPLAGSLVGFGTAIVAGLLTIAGAMTVIGIAWLFYRPLLGISLLVVAAVALFMIYRRGRSRRASTPERLTPADIV